MKYLLDGYNLVHAARAMGGPHGDMSVRKLCRYLAAMPRVEATLILDGRAKPEEPSIHEFPGIKLLYSGAGVKADTVIAQLVETAAVKKKVTVVSDDRAVVLHARGHFAQAMGCEAFLRILTEGAGGRLPEEPGEKSTGTRTPGELDHWMKEFGLGGDPNPKERLENGAKAEEAIKEIRIEDLLGPRG